MTYDEYCKAEKELLEAYRVGEIMEEEDLDIELDALHLKWLEAGGQLS